MHLSRRQFLASAAATGGLAAAPSLLLPARPAAAAVLPDGSAVADMLADYAVMRDQARLRSRS